MSKWQKRAAMVQPIYREAAQELPDEKALRVKAIYLPWENLVKLGKVEAKAGYKFTHAGNLYKCVNPNPEFHEEWIPGIDTAALYTRIDESHAGTREDPIPYSGNMELSQGLHYTQGGVVYLCTRDTGAPVFAALAELVGIYVEVATA